MSHKYRAAISSSLVEVWHCSREYRSERSRLLGASNHTNPSLVVDLAYPCLSLSLARSRVHLVHRLAILFFRNYVQLVIRKFKMHLARMDPGEDRAMTCSSETTHFIAINPLSLFFFCRASWFCFLHVSRFFPSGLVASFFSL